MEYPSNGRCQNCGAPLLKPVQGICVCDYCGSKYTQSITAQAAANSEFDTGKAISFVVKADAAYEKNRIGDAISYYNEALKYDPSNHIIWNKMGRAYRRANELERARECYKKALSIKPDASEVIGNIGALELACNNYPLAYQYCRRAYEAGALDSGDAAVQAANYALATARIGNKKEALQILEIARKKGYGNYGTLKRMIKSS